MSLLGALLKPLFRFRSRRRLPVLEGTLSLSGLEGEVTVIRDSWGVPRIRARGRHDLYFAQGFVHAQDRLWQLEIYRRLARGEMAALAGAGELHTDRLSRTLGFARTALQTWEMTSPRIRGFVEAYSAGVNSFLESGGPLPLEFALVKHAPRPWRTDDTVALICMQSWLLSHGWAGSLVRAQLVEKLGPERAQELDPRYREDHPVTLPEGVVLPKNFASSPLARGGDAGGKGSNAWVVSAARSATGHAVLCNDLHMPLLTPSIWYAVELQDEEGHHLTGMSLPGCPGIWVGHNHRVAWGATLAYIDCEDLFLERMEGPRYLFRGEWRETKVIEERIEVRGAPPHTERVTLTHHGPLVQGLLTDDGAPTALQATSLRAYPSLEGLFGLNEATSWEDFTAAALKIGAPQLNLVYADVEDNIGYRMTGRVPVRARGRGKLPVAGWTGEDEWIGEVPPEEMPHAFNPPQGFIVSCNHRVVTSDYPHYLGETWMNGYRARRLEELITSRDVVSVEDCVRFQFDVHSIPGKELVGRLDGIKTNEPDATICLTLLRDWNGELDPGSTGGTVYQVFLRQLADAILEPKLGADLLHRLLGKGPHPLLYAVTEFYGHWVVTLLRLLDSEETEWLPRGPHRRDLLVRCLSATGEALRKRLGPDPKRWTWGRLHRAPFPHSMSRRAPLGEIFDPPSVSIGGDTDTVLQTAILPTGPYDNNSYSVSYRQIVDLGCLENSRAMLAPGQSGRLGSRHYDDLIEPWRTGRYFPLSGSGTGKTLLLHPLLQIPI